MKPNIAVDIDGVLADSDGPLCGAINEDLDLKLDPKDWTHYWHLDEIMAEYVKDPKEYVGSHFWKDGFLRGLPVYLSAIPAMKRIAGLAKEVHIVTMRNTERNPTCKEQTRLWLDHYGFVYDKIAYTAQKAMYCRQNNIKYIIEDSPEHARECASVGIGVFLVNKPYNQDVVATGKNGIWRVDLLTEIPRLLIEDL